MGNVVLKAIKKREPCWKIQLKPAKAGWLVLAGLPAWL